MKGSLLAISAALLSFASIASAAPPRLAPVMMERMTSTEVRDAIKGGKTTVLIPNASTEATGPAVALGKHIVRARYLGEHIARELGNALVSPVMPFAPTTDESRFPGTVNLSAETFSRVNEDVAESMVKTGFKYIVLMGDHDTNQPLLRALAAKLDEKHRAQGARVFSPATRTRKRTRRSTNTSKRMATRGAGTAAFRTHRSLGRRNPILFAQAGLSSALRCNPPAVLWRWAQLVLKATPADRLPIWARCSWSGR